MGNEVAGEASIADAERRWSFEPAEPWRAGAYTVNADAVLEDLAGNRLREPFERDVRQRRTGPVAESVRIPFEVR